MVAGGCDGEMSAASDAAGRVADLSGKLVKLAELLAAAEETVAEVVRELRQLGLADRLEEELSRLVIPSDAAETLQDELDRISGELATKAVAEQPGQARPAPIEGRPGLLRSPERVSECLMVKCPACGRHFQSPVADDFASLEIVSIDDRTYRCPHCGQTARYETWDHFLE
jgi:hypothetical protein